MTNHGLIQILRSFSKKEMRELRKWLQSPAHNQREDVGRLFEYLYKEDRLLQDDALDKQKVFTYLYPDTEYDDARFRQAAFFFLKATEEYLIYQELLKDPVQTTRILASVYRKRQLPKFFERTIREAKDTIEAHPYRNGTYLRNAYLLEQEKYSFLSRQQRNVMLNLQESSDALDIAFIADKLRQCCLMISHRNVFKTEYTMGFINEVLAYTEQHDLLRYPAIAIYYYSYKAITEQDREDHFPHLKAQILQYDHLFPPIEIRDIYLLAINYCNYRFNQGAKAYLRESLELYKVGLGKGVFIDQGEISRWTFRNVVTAALRLKEYAWCEQFIQEYKDYLEPQYREGFTNFNLAKLYFEKKDYKKAMRLLSTFEFNDDILVTLNAKIMLLKMLYEEGEYDALDSLLNSMRAYLQRKEVMGYHKDHYKLVVRFTKKLLRLSPYSPVQRDKLISEIEQTEAFTEKEWFLEQLEAVK